MEGIILKLCAAGKPCPHFVLIFLHRLKGKWADVSSVQQQSYKLNWEFLKCKTYEWFGWIKADIKNKRVSFGTLLESIYLFPPLFFPLL